ncbi:TPA: hypothetical protein GX533_02885 [Candidatus Dojkabacteria bacterium]|uniref:Uncharacterized protein n=1 Tax=Candidatus Dojkabacteria bacterium TaxID=2099670 RepID=A0A832QFK8_9BACT|nr:hypothetical protein [Candidatus Dojkabacteria bacterium]
MKFFLITILTSLFSVSFLYYLLNNPNFLPTLSSGEVNWINFVVFITLSVVLIFSLLILMLYLIFKITRKEISHRERVVHSLKMGGSITFGLLIVFLLHIFQVLNFFWGLGILVIVLFLIFVV